MIFIGIRGSLRIEENGSDDICRMGNDKGQDVAILHAGSICPTAFSNILRHSDISRFLPPPHLHLSVLRLPPCK